MPDYPWGHNRPFNSYAEYFKRSKGFRVQKLTLDAGFTCPNRDGSKGRGGCTYCLNDAFNPSYCIPQKSITQQLTEGAEFHKVRYRRAHSYLAYFQAYTNTYAELDQLKPMYEEALAFPGVIGLVVGTRPDCVENALMDYFQELSKSCYFVIEYGVESHLDKTLLTINRGHDFSCSLDAIKRSHERDLQIGAHMILGLPGESREQILEGALIMGQQPLHSIKLHQLQIIKGTAMAAEYIAKPETFRFWSLEEYIELVIDYLEVLNPEIVVERFAGEVPPRYLVGPGWGHVRNDQILVMTEKRMGERNTWQGKKYGGSLSAPA